MQVAPAYRQLDFVQSLVAGDGFVLRPEQVERQALAQCPVALRRQCAGLDDRGLHHVRGPGDSGRGVAADVDQRQRAEPDDELEVVVAHVKDGVLDQLVDRVPGEIAHVQPVPLGGLAELVHADDAAGAADVAHDDAANALEVLRQVARDDPRLDVGRASGGVVHDHGDDPPGELLGVSRVAQDEQERGEQSTNEFHRCHVGVLD